MRCVLTTPALSSASVEKDVTSARESFWEQVKRVVGLYVRSATKSQQLSPGIQLRAALQPCFNIISKQHETLATGAAFMEVIEIIVQFARQVRMPILLRIVLTIC